MGNVVKRVKEKIVETRHKKELARLRKLNIPVKPGDDGYEEWYRSYQNMLDTQRLDREETERRCSLSVSLSPHSPHPLEKQGSNSDTMSPKSPGSSKEQNNDTEVSADDMMSDSA